MNQRRLRSWHRKIGTILAPFLFLQALSGLFLSFGLYRRISNIIEKEAPPPITGAWELFMAKLHYGPGMIGNFYHCLLFLAIFWVLASGLWIRIDLGRKQG